MEEAAGTFGRWLQARLQGGALSQQQLAAQIGYDSSLISKIKRGERRAGEELQVRLMAALYQAGALAHAGELLAGWSLLGVTRETALERVRRVPLLGERAAVDPQVGMGRARREFLAWLEAWQATWLDPEAQGVQVPRHYVAPVAQLATLKALLLGPELAGPVVVWGSGGSGKSVLAQAVALDWRVQAHFWHGVLWGHVGPGGDPRAVLEAWGRWLGLKSAEQEPLTALRQRIRSRLAEQGRRYLLVLDDVWEAEALETLLVAGPGSATLVTLRERRLAQQAHIDEHLVRVVPWEPAAAQALVRRRLGGTPGTPAQIAELAALVDYLPLALVLGAAVVKEWGWSATLAALREPHEALEAVALPQAERRRASVRRTLAVSYAYRSRAGRRLLYLLGGLAPGQPFALEYLFPEGEPGGQHREERQALRELVQASLVEELEPRRRYRLPRWVALFVRGRLATEERAGAVWRRHVRHALDLLVRALHRQPGRRGQRRILRRHWPHIVHAWLAVGQGWRRLLEGEVTPGARALAWAEGFGYLGGAYLQQQREWAALQAWIERAEALRVQARAQDPALRIPEATWATIWVWGLEAAVRLGDGARHAALLAELRELAAETGNAHLSLRVQVWEGWWALQQGLTEPAAAHYAAVSAALGHHRLVRGLNEADRLALAEACEFAGAYALEQGRGREASRWYYRALRSYARLAPEMRAGICAGRIEQLLEQQARARLLAQGWRAGAEEGAVWLAYRAALQLPLRQAGVEVVLWALRGKAWGLAERLLARLADLAEPEETGDLWALQALGAGLRGQPEAAREAWRQAEGWYAEHPGVQSALPWLVQVRRALEQGERPHLPEPEVTVGSGGAPTPGLSSCRAFVARLLSGVAEGWGPW